MCAQRRLRSAWASAQSDQSLRCPHEESLGPWVLSYPLSTQRSLWSDWADAQADLSLRWAHSHFVGFVMRRLKSVALISLLQEHDSGNKLAATWQNQQSECASSEDSDQAGHPPSLIRVFAVRMKIAWVHSYPLSAQRRLWSDWADAQADLSLRWAHTHFVGFVMSRLKLADNLGSEQSAILASVTVCYEPRHEKTCLRVFWPGKTQTGLRSHSD